MSRVFAIVTFVISMAVVMPSQAGSGHAHNPDGSHSVGGHTHGPISKNKVVARAKHKVLHLTKKGKIDKSWASTKVDKVIQKDFGKGKEWVVSFKNSKITDKSKQTLYVFYSLDGHYIAANYTGE